MSEPTFYLAGCIIVDEAKRILMLHRNTAKRVQWEIPGGKIHPGEDARATAARVVQEELGVSVQVRDQLGDKHFEEDGLTMHYTWFAAHIVEGELKIMEPNIHDKFAYLSVDELKNLHHELSTNGRNFLEFVARGDIRLENLTFV